MAIEAKQKKAVINEKDCVACGVCEKICPKKAIKIQHGIYASVYEELCVDCGVCAKACPAGAITAGKADEKAKQWYEYLWIFSAFYLTMGFFNILFAWLGLLCFMIPLVISIVTGGKAYCNKYCGRGQLFDVLGNHCKFSMQNKTPKLLKSKFFRYGFMVIFLTMFANMIYTTYLVAAGAKSLMQAITLFWTFKLPWQWVYHGEISGWIAQFAFGFYSVMLTATLIGLVSMIFFKPRTWCVFCPMGTITQLICKIKAPKAQNF